MNIFLIALISFSPLFVAIALKKYFANSIPFINIVVSAFFGFLACIPIIALASLFSLPVKTSFFYSFTGVLFKSFFINGLIEESCKLFFLLFLFKAEYSKKKFIYLVIILGLALGGFETLVYAIKNVNTLFIRVATAVLLHGITCGLSACFYYALKTKTDKKSFHFFLFAILTHGFYNFFNSLGTFFFFFALVAIFFGLTILLREYKTPSK
ncbi:MAG: PrsW family glutamic-type intramembrane protease [Treponemataceae bacterium]